MIVYCIYIERRAVSMMFTWLWWTHLHACQSGVIFECLCGKNSFSIHLLDVVVVGDSKKWKKERHNYKPQQTAKTKQKDSPSSCLRGNFGANTRSQRPRRNKPLKTPLQPKVECLPRACPFMSNPTSTAGQTAQLGPAPTLHDLQPTYTSPNKNVLPD